MVRLDCKLQCVTCENIIAEWITIDLQGKWKFFAKCDSCSVMNFFSVPRTLDLEEIPNFAESGCAKSVLSIAEIDRLSLIKKRYKIPDHIPMSQYEKYRRIRIKQRCPSLEESLH